MCSLLIKNKIKENRREKMRYIKETIVSILFRHVTLSSYEQQISFFFCPYKNQQFQFWYNTLRPFITPSVHQYNTASLRSLSVSVFIVVLLGGCCATHAGRRPLISTPLLTLSSPCLKFVCVFRCEKGNLERSIWRLQIVVTVGITCDLRFLIVV